MTVAALFVDDSERGVYPALLGDSARWGENRDARRYAGPLPVVAHPPCHLWVNLAAVNWRRYGRQRPAWYPGGSDGGCFAAALAAVRRWGGVLEHPAGSHAWAAHGLRKPECRALTPHGPFTIEWQHSLISNSVVPYRPFRDSRQFPSIHAARDYIAKECDRVIGDHRLLDQSTGQHIYPVEAYKAARIYDDMFGWKVNKVDSAWDAGREYVCEVWQSAYGHRARKRTWLLYCGKRPPFELDWTRKPGTHQCGWFDRNKPTVSKREASATPEGFARELIRLAEWSRG